MRKAKLITPFIMLLAGLATSIAMYLKHYDLTLMLKILLVVLIVFYFVGDTFRYVYERFRPMAIPEEEEPEDVNKEIIADEGVEEEYHADEDIDEELESNLDEDEQNDTFEEPQDNQEYSEEDANDVSNETEEEEYMDSDEAPQS